jgi:hypothetical protein
MMVVPLIPQLDISATLIELFASVNTEAATKETADVTGRGNAGKTAPGTNVAATVKKAPKPVAEKSNSTTIVSTGIPLSQPTDSSHQNTSSSCGSIIATLTISGENPVTSSASRGQPLQPPAQPPKVYSNSELISHMKVAMDRLADSY